MQKNLKIILDEKYEDVYGAGLLRVDESYQYPAILAKRLFSMLKKLQKKFGGGYIDKRK
jgi:hypothetical protein